MAYQILNDDGDVINTIKADQQFVEDNHPNRWRFIPDPIIHEWVINKAAMLLRFSFEEYVSILTAAKTDVAVQAWHDVFNATTNFDLKNEKCIQQINFLVSKNLLTQTRANEILTMPAEPNEMLA